MSWGWAETAAADGWRRACRGGARASASAECLGCGGAAYRSEASYLDTAARPWDVRDELVRDEARQRYFYGTPDAPQQPSQRAERAWLVGSLHVRAIGHLEEQNEADCAAADRAGELNPDTDRWFAAAENEMLGYGGRAGPAPPEFYARSGPERVLAKPEPLSVDGELGAGWPDGSDLGSESSEPEPHDSWDKGCSRG